MCHASGSMFHVSCFIIRDYRLNLKFGFENRQSTFENRKPKIGKRNAGGRGGEPRARAGGRGGEPRARAGGGGGEPRARAGGRGGEPRARAGGRGESSGRGPAAERESSGPGPRQSGRAQGEGRWQRGRVQGEGRRQRGGAQGEGRRQRGRAQGEGRRQTVVGLSTFNSTHFPNGLKSTARPLRNTTFQPSALTTSVLRSSLSSMCSRLLHSTTICLFIQEPSHLLVVNVFWSETDVSMHQHQHKPIRFSVYGLWFRV